jgi:hypothetical protein
MPSRVLKLKSETNSLGTTVYLVDKNRSYNEKIVEYLDYNPLKNNKANLTGGLLFRSPDIAADVWPGTLETLSRIDGEFSITARLTTDKNKKQQITAWARFSDKNDAAMFAWANVQHWQKWSDAQDAEDRAETKSKKNTLKITKDGRLVGNVTLTTLSD